MPSLAEFQKRFCRRVIGDLPADLEALDCEDALGVLRLHVRRLLDRTASQTDRRPAYAVRPSFSIPGSPPTSRLRSAKGNTPFHFAKNEVGNRTAREFDVYASGKGQGAFPADLAAERVVEIDTQMDGAGRDAYMDSHGGLAGAAPDRWTNLSDDPVVRGQQWVTIEAFERDGRVQPDGNPPGLSFFYDRAPTLFDDVAAQPACPAGLRTLIAKQQARVAAGTPLSERKARDGVRWVDERAFDVYDWIKSRPDWPVGADKAGRPVRVSEGRAVQTHLAGEGEYPAVLQREARGRIRTGMIDLVQRQRNPTSAAETGWFIPMTICDHVPDGLNDPLNDHFHWLIGTRRARFLDNGTLAFEGRKVDAITRKGWLQVMREELARLTNVELEWVESSMRYHAGTLVEMGIDATPQQKMGGRRTVLERAGFSTERGLLNDTEGWRRAFASAEHDHAAALAMIGKDQPADARTTKIAAAELRHEAAQIQLLIDMSRSRGERTLRFAPEYAAAAASPRVIDGWLSRGREAAHYLCQLDIDLASERTAVADRLAQAIRLDAEAVLLMIHGRASAAALPPEQFARATTTVVEADTPIPDRQAAPTRGDMHRTVDIIAKAPLLISEVAGQLQVTALDDPDRLVAGIDLSDAWRRLDSIRRVQQRELAQVQAFARRHGGDALFDDACDTHSVWFKQAVRKWRDTPVMQRWLQERDAVLARDREKDITAHIDRRRWQGQELADRPSLDGLSSLEDVRSLDEIAGYRDTRIEPVATAESEIPALPRPAPVQAVQPSAPNRLTPQAKRPSPTPDWSEIELRHKIQIERRGARSRSEIDRAIAAALAQRTGGHHDITPYAARLLQRIEQGFDPAAVPTRVGPFGRMLDQRDATEIAVLSRNPGFCSRIAAAKRRDPTLSALVADALRDRAPADFLGRVGMERGRIQFAPQFGEQGELRTPLEWAERALALVVAHAIPLTRHGDLVGIYDAEILRLSQYNYPGLLHPAIQAGLDAERRIQAEQMQTILARVQAGALELDISIRPVPMSDMITTSVRILNGTADERAFVFNRQFDADLYFQCCDVRRAGAAIVPPPRHANAVVRAWLQAQGDASSPVLELLTDKVRAIGANLSTVGMADSDVRALSAIFASPAVAPARRPAHGVRQRSPILPGRRDPGR